MPNNEKPECVEDYNKKQLIMSDGKCKKCEFYYRCKFIMQSYDDVMGD